jgi:hypothetical protein
MAETTAFNERAVVPDRARYDDRFNNMLADVSTATSDPQSRVRLADAISAQNKDAEVYRPNQQPQWGKVLINVLSGDYNEAYKWYNGGGVKEVEARDLNNNVFFKEENELGATGRYKDNKGRLLSNKEIEELNSRGGVITKNDQTVLQTAPWVNGKYNSELTNRALTSQLHLATNDAFNSAKLAGGANQNIEEQLRIASGMRGVLDHISGLPADRRQKLLGYINRLNQIGSSAGTTAERRIGANVGAGASQTLSGNVGVGLGGGAGTGMGGGGAGGVAPRGAVDAGLGASNTGSTQTGATGGATNVGTTGQNQMQQEQQNLERAINQELQGVISGPAQFQQFMRLQALNASNYAAYNGVPTSALPPTWNLVPETDLYAGGADRMIANLVNQQRNNALLAAWSKTLMQSMRDMRTGKANDVGIEAEKFQNSELFNAINNTYKYKMDSQLSGKLVKPPPGTKMVNRRNEVVTYGE